MDQDKAPLILAVDHNRRNLELLTQFLTQDGYRIVSVTTLEELAQVLNGEPPIELALVDISGFDRTIWRHCDRLRRRHVPFMVLVSREDAAGIQRQSYSHGARSVLVKPMAKQELRLILNVCCGHHDEPDTPATGP